MRALRVFDIVDDGNDALLIVPSRHVPNVEDANEPLLLSCHKNGLDDTGESWPVDWPVEVKQFNDNTDGPILEAIPSRVVKTTSVSGKPFGAPTSTLLHVSLVGFLAFVATSYAKVSDVPEAITIEMVALQPEPQQTTSVEPPQPVAEPEPQQVDVADIPEPEPPKPKAEVIEHKPELAPKPKPEPVKPKPVKPKLAEKPKPIQPSRPVVTRIQHASLQSAADLGPSAAERGAATASYSGTLRSWLERHKRYPGEAKAQNIQGTAMLRFVVDRNGRVLSHSIQRSAGHSLLDAEVKALIQRAQPLPSMPAVMGVNTLAVTVPIGFYIR